MHKTVLGCLSREELAALVGVAPSRVAQWTKDGTIPADWYYTADGNAYAYAPVTVTLGLLILELESFFGKSCPATKPAARRAAPTLRLYWETHPNPSDKVYAHVRVSEDSDVELKLPLTFLARARAKLAARVPA